MPGAFPPDLLALVDSTREIDIVTSGGPDGPIHRTIIWLVVDQDEVFARSHRGAGARWYREATGTGSAAIELEGRSVQVRVVPAADPESVRRTSEGLLRKYQGSPSTASMLRPEILATTIRLEPA